MDKLRFNALDGIRGIVALAVMLLHYAGLSGLNWLPRAWMAVDVFFIMSGFVLMHSYADKIKNGNLNFLEFLKIRLLRLMPLFIVGLLLGSLSMFYSCRLSGGTCSTNILPAMGFGMFMLPYINDAMWPIGVRVSQFYFPLNQPSWSLFFELFINIIFFYWVVITKTKHLMKLLTLGLLSLIIVYHFNGSVNVGFSINSNFYWGFTRVFYHFFVGVLIYTQYLKYGFNSKLVALLSIMLLLSSYTINSSLVGMWSLFILAPFVVLTSAKVNFNGFASKICAWFGDISYPLYITHLPIFQLLYLFWHLDGLMPSIRVLVMGIIAIILSWVFSVLDKIFRFSISKSQRAIPLPNHANL